MKMILGLKGSTILVAFCLLIAFSANAFDPSQTFQMKCSSCHTIGEGDDVGPDLKDITKRRDQAWLVKFIKSSQSLVQSGDAVAVELFNKFKKKKMPDQDLSDADVVALLAWIEGGGKATTAPGSFKSALDATAEDIAAGKLLFSGNTRLSGGGPACISCHSAGDAGIIGGGSLGPDLTSSFSGYGDNGLSKVLTQISFPSMLEIYKDKALSEDEVFKIKSYLYSTDKAGPVNLGTSKKFFLSGLIGFLLMLGVFDLSWRGRRKKTKRPIE